MGFLSNMFNLKTKYVDDPDDPADLAPKESMKAFYLDPDSAKTLKKNAKAPAQESSAGDKVLETQDSVAKDTAISEVAPVIEEQAKVEEQVTSEPETTSSEPSESTSQSSPTDDGMDMFRNMARKMKR